MTIKDSTSVSNCRRFEGQPFAHNVDNCRAGGSALFLVLRAGARALVTKTTVTARGSAGRRRVRQSLLLLQRAGTRRPAQQHLHRQHRVPGPDNVSALAYQETFPQGDQVFDIDYSVVRHVKNATARASTTCGEGAVRLANEGINPFDARLPRDEPGPRRRTPAGAPSVDYAGRPRDARPNVGAYRVRHGRRKRSVRSELLGLGSGRRAGRGGACVHGDGDPVGLRRGHPGRRLDFRRRRNGGGLHFGPRVRRSGNLFGTMTASVAGVTCARTDSLTITAAGRRSFRLHVSAVTLLPARPGPCCRTDVAAVSLADGAASLALTFSQTGGGSLVRTATVSARGSREFADVLVSLFDRAGRRSLRHPAGRLRRASRRLLTHVQPDRGWDARRVPSRCRRRSGLVPGGRESCRSSEDTAFKTTSPS